MVNGVLAGYPVDTLKVRLLDGSYHNVDSDALSFELAAKIGFKEACKKAVKVLLEPIMKLEVLTPDDYIGDVTGDLNKRRGHLEGIESKAGMQIVKAKVPLSEMFGYTTQLRSMTSGQGSAMMEFDHYEVVPASVAEAIKEKRK